jgi:hypothetical protein
MTFLLALEAALCFALPLYMLLWGLLSTPLWIGAVQRGGDYAWWHLFDIVAGCLGVIGLFRLLRFHLSNGSGMSFQPKTITVLGVLGLLALWDTPTQNFTSFDFDLFTLVFAGLPTLCAAHLLVLAFLRARRESPNNALHATREDSRA